MLHFREMHRLLQAFNDWPALQEVVIDTNLSWDPAKFEGTPRPKVSMMASFHPSEIAEEDFFFKLRHVQTCGWRVRMVNYVVTPARVSDLKRLMVKCQQHGTPMTVLPCDSNSFQFSAEELGVLRDCISALD